MAAQLDTLNFAKQDPEGMHEHISNWVPLFLHWWQKAEAFPLPAHFVKAKKVVMSGMGGSGQAGAIVKDLALAKGRWPIELVKDYTLPAWIDSETLVIATSHSGTTEETISTFIDAYGAGAKLIGLGTGGTLASLCRKYKVPMFEHDFTVQPRAALPVHLAVVLNFLVRLGQIELPAGVMEDIKERGERLQRQYSPGTPTGSNPAKRLAEEVAERLPIIVGDGVLTGVASRIKAQFNENGKGPSYYEIIPEMNHNALLGTEMPRGVLDKFTWLMFDSQFTHEQNRNRMVLTEKYLKDRRLQVKRLSFNATNPLAEVVEALILGDWVSYYTAMLHQVDPSPVEGIAGFKKALEHK